MREMWNFTGERPWVSGGRRRLPIFGPQKIRTLQCSIEQTAVGTRRLPARRFKGNEHFHWMTVTMLKAGPRFPHLIIKLLLLLELHLNCFSALVYSNPLPNVLAGLFFFSMPVSTGSTPSFYFNFCCDVLPLRFPFSLTFPSRFS